MAAVVMVAADMVAAAIRVDTQWVDIRQAAMRADMLVVDMPAAVMSLDTAVATTGPADRSADRFMTAAMATTGLAASFPLSAVLSMASLAAASDRDRRQRD